MTTELNTLAENAFTACYEKGLGENSTDSEAHMLRAVVAKMAKEEFYKELNEIIKENKNLKADFSDACERINELEEEFGQ
jgi:hypothetical protein